MIRRPPRSTLSSSSAASDVYKRQLPGVFIDQIQHAHRPSIMCLRTDEVVAPDMIGVLWTQPHAGPVVEPQPPSRLLLLWNRQPLTTPDSRYPVLADLPACPLEQRRDPTIAIATILAGQRYDGLGERIFVVALCRPIALRAAWLFHHPARLPLAHPMRLPRMAHRTTPSFRA